MKNVKQLILDFRKGSADRPWGTTLRVREVREHVHRAEGVEDERPLGGRDAAPTSTGIRVEESWRC